MKWLTRMHEFLQGAGGSIPYEIRDGQQLEGAIERVILGNSHQTPSAVFPDGVLGDAENGGTQADVIVSHLRDAPPEGVQHRYESHYSDEHVALLAETLTSRVAGDRWEDRAQPLKDEAQLRNRASAVLTKLESQAALWYTQLDPATTVVKRLLRTLAQGDLDQLAELGIDLGYAWLDDVVMAAIAGATVVEIETVGPYAAHHITVHGLETQIDRLPADEKAGLLLAGVFRDVFADCPNVRGITLIDDLTSDVPGRDLTQAERNRYVVAMADIFRVFGAILPQDVPGRDYVLVRESGLLPAVDELIQRLRESSEGTVQTSFDGDVVFHPTDAFIEKLALSSANRRKELRRRGILVKRQGRPTCQALEAASFLRLTNPNAMNVVMLDKYFLSQQDKTYALVRALDLVTRDQHHNVFYDAERLPPELITYAMCELLAEQTRRCLKTLDLRAAERASAVDRTGPASGAALTRKGRISPRDRVVMESVAQHLAVGTGPAGSHASLVADVGGGCGLYPAMILAPYVADDGAIDVIEPETENSAAQDALQPASHQWISDSLNEHQELLIGAAGGRYLNSVARAQRLGNYVMGSVYSLPKNRYDIATSYFVSESIADYRREFHAAIRSLASCIKPDGLLIVTHAVGPRNTEELGASPKITLTVDEISEAYRDANLTFRMQNLGDRGLGDEGLGDKVLGGRVPGDKVSGAKTGAMKSGDVVMVIARRV